MCRKRKKFLVRHKDPRLGSIKISDLSLATKRKEQNKLQKHFPRGEKKLASCYPGSPCPETCTIARACPQTCKIPRTSEKSPVPTSLLTVQLHTPNRNYVVATAILVTVTFCFHNSALSWFILNEIFDMLQQQETLFCGYTNLRSHVQIQISNSNHSCKRGCTCELR